MDDHYDIRPDTITFNTCIKGKLAFERSCCYLYHETCVYSKTDHDVLLLFSAWCNSKHIDAPQKAEDLLCKLETYPEYPKRNGMLVVRPNLLSYNTVINAWAKSSSLDSASRAESLLTRMLKRYKEEAYSTIKPDVVTFSSVLNALAKSKSQYKGKLMFYENEHYVLHSPTTLWYPCSS